MSDLESTIDTLNSGRMVLLLEEEHENEGDLILAAEWVTPAAINFMMNYARGLICLALDPKRVDALGLPLMVPSDTSGERPAFTVSIDAREGIESGTSAADRAKTVRMAADPTKTAAAFVSPGHVFPLRARERGVLERTGHTEGAVDLMKIAGLEPAAVLCEVLNPDGTMARREDLTKFSLMHGIPLIQMNEIIRHRKLHIKKDVVFSQAAVW